MTRNPLSCYKFTVNHGFTGIIAFIKWLFHICTKVSQNKTKQINVIIRKKYQSVIWAGFGFTGERERDIRGAFALAVSDWCLTHMLWRWALWRNMAAVASSRWMLHIGGGWGDPPPPSLLCEELWVSRKALYKCNKLLSDQTACNTPKTKENLKSHHMTPLRCIIIFLCVTTRQKVTISTL